MNRAGHPAARAAVARGFERIRSGPYQLCLNAETAPHAGAIAVALRELGAAASGGAGNRAGGFRVALPAGPQLFVRRARRGGAMRLLLDDLYLGLRPRPFAELAVAAEAMRRGVPLAEPMGAAVRWAAPALYRGFFISRALSGMTLWEFVRTDDDPGVRGHVLERAREAIEQMLQAGLYHPDLNLHNLFVTRRGESFSVIILDLDKARLGDQPLGERARRQVAARLARSAHKLDPRGRFIDAAAMSILKPA
ncbi:MAG TPA: lipopolysaccharide kinase InaA family protein [Candidatus Binataceae bacterium]|nr:lipopolysaccharide kinase InaA family protein [Candidatus Binataceae bacterium]